MKFEKRHIVIALLVLYIFSIAITTIGFVHAVEKTIYVMTTDENTVSGGTNYYLYLDEDTPLTLGFLKEHPEYEITFISYDSSGNTTNVAVYWEMPNGGVGSACNTSASATPPYVLTYNNNSYLINCYNKYGEESLDYPIKLGNSNSNTTIVMNSNFIFNSDGTLTDPDEIPEETEPVVPPEDGGEDTAGLLDSLLNGIKEFFSDLFSPILSFIEDVQETFSSTDKLLGWFNSLYEKIKGYTMKPVLDFFEDLTQNDAVALVLLFWDFPFVKEFTLAVVAVLIVSGLFRLLNSL